MNATYRVASVIVAAICSASGLSATSAHQVGSVAEVGPPEALLSVARTYLKDYQDKLTFVIADEDYSQSIRDQVPLDPKMPKGRVMKSELYFIFAPETKDWLAIRDVVSVDGKAPEDRLKIAEMLGLVPPTQVAAVVKTKNSRFNIGRTFRNFNEPTLALQILDVSRAPDVSFHLSKSEHQQADTISTFAFRETGSVTLLSDLTLKPVPSTGEIVFDQAGRMRRTVLKSQIGTVSVELTTTYGRDRDLDLWVPVLFREKYEDGVDQPSAKDRFNGPGHELIVCEAKYTHYHRFEVTGGIKK